LKLGTVVVFDSLSKPIDFGLKKPKVRVIVRVVAWNKKKICRNAPDVTENNSCDKFTPLT